MIFFALLIGLHWLGFTSDKLSEAQILSLLEIIKVGLGGYILGRSAEKTMKAYKASDRTTNN